MSQSAWAPGPLCHLGCATFGKMLSTSEPWVCTASTSERRRSKGQGPVRCRRLHGLERRGLHGAQEAG